MSKSAFIYSADLEKNAYPEACPFNSHRAGLTMEKADSMGLLSGSDKSVVAPAPLTRDEMTSFHSEDYLAAIEAAENGELSERVFHAGLGTPDCPIFPGMIEHASFAAGGTLTGARLILDGSAHVVLSPSGGFHHAMSNRAGGFCYINDIVIACMELSRRGKRVCFLDVDVHHCDGVQSAFYSRADVLTVSMHESGETLFPGTGAVTETGAGDGVGYAINLPLPVGTYDDIYLKAFNQAVLPVVKAYDPDVVLIEVGMDALSGDPLAHLNLTNNALAGIVDTVVGLGKPILATGGGGYNVENTVRGWTLVWSVLCGEDHSEALGMGMGGVMLENSDWLGGLRDRTLLSAAGRRDDIDHKVDDVIEVIQREIFPVHGLA